MINLKAVDSAWVRNQKTTIAFPEYEMDLLKSLQR